MALQNDEIVLIAAIGLLTVGFIYSNKIANTKNAAIKTGSNMALAQKNNNPLNIRYNPANNWQGQNGNNSGFAVFSDSYYGYRAAFILLDNYVKKGFNTIEKIVGRWAPASENPTKNYINFVSNRSFIWPDTPINKNDYIPILEAMAIFEGGKVDKIALQEGHKLAFG